jgi:hypothetical protein
VVGVGAQSLKNSGDGRQIGWLGAHTSVVAPDRPQSDRLQCPK